MVSNVQTSIKGIQLICPYCNRHPFVVYSEKEGAFTCRECGRVYNKWDGRPCFIDKDIIRLDPYWSQTTEGKRVSRLIKLLKMTYMALKAPRVFPKKKPHFELLNVLRQEKDDFMALYIGYNQPFEEDLQKHIIQLEIVPKKYVDIIAPGEKIPFPDSSFDLVVISGVIEHTQRPFEVVDESFRVLKYGGRLYISSPWIYPFHGGDNYRFSHEGLRLLCSRFSKIEIGSLHGPLHSLGIFLQYSFVEYLSFRRRYLRYALSVIASWLFFPLILADAMLHNPVNPRFVLDANIYAIATKEIPEQGPKESDEGDG
ncbi:MAG: hypothetical protein DRO87_12895 [Candidatus Thorarchaeota archaeon]|nr:MAG: hypothetical protein DRO87_12895 [Candidatus Thorarchaeota archaeon]